VGLFNKPGTFRNMPKKGSTTQKRIEVKNIPNYTGPPIYFNPKKANPFRYANGKAVTNLQLLRILKKQAKRS